MKYEVSGYCYAPGKSARTPCRLILGQHRHELYNDDHEPKIGDISLIQCSDRIGNVPRRLTLPDQSVFETTENDLVDQWLRQSGFKHGGAILHTLETRWRWIIPAIFIVVLTVFTGFKWGLPWASTAIAKSIPSNVVESVSKNTLSALDKFWFEKSDLSQEKQNELIQQFEKLQKLDGFTVSKQRKLRLNFRKMGIANAFALPSGDIVITDQFVANATNLKQIDAVLLHEIGHVVHEHGLQQITRSSIVAFIIAMMLGDPSGLEELLVALPTVLLQADYSRLHEREADDFALSIMKRNGIDPVHFADALVSLTRDPEENTPIPIEVEQEEDDQIKLFDYFSSHPATNERVDRARQLSNEFHSGE